MSALKNSIRLFLLMAFLPGGIFADSTTPSYIDFFFDADQKPMIGLSCSSEKECQALCGGTEKCQKPVPTCLNCAGSRSPYLNDFFNNLGELTTACFDQGAITSEADALFDSVSMVPLTPSSAFNPLGLKDLGLVLKFMTLCPAGTLEPVAVAFTDSFTHAVLDVPLMKCGKTLLPLVRLNEDCATKVAWIHDFIRESSEALKLLRGRYESALNLGDRLPLKYDLLQLSEFSEAQYVRCDSDSKAFCQNLCHSSLSCTRPLPGAATAKAISAFNQGKWTACESERFSPQTLWDYLETPDTVSFSYSSLAQAYDLPLDTGGFGDFGVIRSILNEFSGVFVSRRVNQDPSSSSLFISSAYREKLQKKMQSLCDETTRPVILGRGNRIERVFCISDLNGYFRILAAEDESCATKKTLLNPELAGGSK